MNWQPIDTQQQLDALNKAVCWEDSTVVECHGGRGLRRHYPPDVSRSGYERLDLHVLLRTPGGQQPFLELALVHCDRLAADIFDRLHMTGTIDSLKRVEIVSGNRAMLLRAARVIYRWLARAPTDGTYYWNPNGSSPE
jgi:hypothetical protein